MGRFLGIQKYGLVGATAAASRWRLPGTWFTCMWDKKATTCMTNFASALPGPLSSIQIHPGWNRKCNPTAAFHLIASPLQAPNAPILLFSEFFSLFLFFFTSAGKKLQIDDNYSYIRLLSGQRVIWPCTETGHQLRQTPGSLITGGLRYDSQGPFSIRIRTI